MTHAQHLHTDHARLCRLEALLSDLSNALESLSAKIDSKLAAITGELAHLRAELTTAQAAAGNAPTPDDLAAIAAISAKIDALDPTNSATTPAQ